MAIYDGETARITAVLTNYQNVVVDNTGVSTAYVNLYDAQGNYVFLNEPLTWNSSGTSTVNGVEVTGYWYYDWQNALPGSFTSQAVFEGPTFKVYNYGRVNVRPLRVEPTGNPTTIVNDPNDPH